MNLRTFALRLMLRGVRIVAESNDPTEVDDWPQLCHALRKIVDELCLLDGTGAYPTVTN